MTSSPSPLHSRCNLGTSPPGAAHRSRIRSPGCGDSSVTGAMALGSEYNKVPLHARDVFPAGPLWYSNIRSPPREPAAAEKSGLTFSVMTDMSSF